MIRQMNKNEVMEALKELLDKLIKSGLMPELDAAKKEELVLNLTKKIERDPIFILTKDDLSNHNMRVSLGAALIAENDPSKKFDSMLFLRKDLSLTKEDRHLLEELFKPMLEEFAKKNPTLRPELKKTLDKLIDTLEHDLRLDTQKELKNVLTMAKMLKTDKTSEHLLRDQRIADCGVDTRNPGGIVAVLQAVVYGDQIGRRDDLGTSGDNFKAQLNLAGSGKTDPLGMRFDVTVKTLMSSVIANQGELNASETRNIVGQTLGVALHPKNTPQIGG